MNKTTIVGIGSRIMRDDGIAIRVAEFLTKKITDENIQVVIGETDMAYCMEMVEGSDCLVVLDAMYSGQEPGRVCMIPISDAAQKLRKPYSQHEASLLEMLAASFPEMKGFVIGIEPAVVGFGFELSNLLKYRFKHICSDVEKLLGTILESEKNA